MHMKMYLVVGQVRVFRGQESGWRSEVVVYEAVILGDDP